ncbi:hypothetical protein [Lewinella sp. JB7]|uniref:hypothetical protein n=1 Tax=Lewinella sp. JB7 TaxID=2962887 RepID=UPI0020C9603B|nr:hypothetical protein [Lewinella sp. JB7]MCP9237699.1 hypothetical protein [Lewinella sp. JB7]
MEEDKLRQQPVTFKKGSRTFREVDPSSFQELLRVETNEQALILTKKGASKADPVIDPSLFGPNGRGKVHCQGNPTVITIPRGMRRLKRVKDGQLAYWNGNRDNTPELYTPDNPGDKAPRTFPLVGRIDKITKDDPGTDPLAPDVFPVRFDEMPRVLKATLACSHTSTCAQALSATGTAKEYLAVAWEWDTYYNSPEEIEYYTKVHGLTRGQPAQLIATLVTDKDHRLNTVVWVSMVKGNPTDSDKMLQSNKDHLALSEWKTIKQPAPGAELIMDRQGKLVLCKSTILEEDRQPAIMPAQ